MVMDDLGYWSEQLAALALSVIAVDGGWQVPVGCGI